MLPLVAALALAADAPLLAGVSAAADLSPGVGTAAPADPASVDALAVAVRVFAGQRRGRWRPGLVGEAGWWRVGPLGGAARSALMVGAGVEAGREYGASSQLELVGRALLEAAPLASDGPWPLARVGATTSLGIRFAQAVEVRGDFGRRPAGDWGFGFGISAGWLW